MQRLHVVLPLQSVAISVSQCMMVLVALPAATWLLHCSTSHQCAKDSSNAEDGWCCRPRGRVDEQIRGFFCAFFFFLSIPVDGGLLSVWLGLELSAKRPSCSGAVTGIIEQLLRDTLPLVFACCGNVRVPEWAPVGANPAFLETDGYLFHFLKSHFLFEFLFVCEDHQLWRSPLCSSTPNANKRSSQMFSN